MNTKPYYVDGKAVALQVRSRANDWKDRALAAEAMVEELASVPEMYRINSGLAASEIRAKELEQLLAETEARADAAEKALALEMDNFDRAIKQWIAIEHSVMAITQTLNRT